MPCRQVTACPDESAWHRVRQDETESQPPSIMYTKILIAITTIFLFACCDDAKNKKNAMKGGQEVAAEKDESKPTSTTSTVKTELRIESIRKVFVHKPGGYSILWENENKELIAWEFGELCSDKSPSFIKEKQGSWHAARIRTRVINDVEGNGVMWGVIRHYNEYWFEVDIHVTVDDIGGGSFRYREGKMDKTGSTNVLK